MDPGTDVEVMMRTQGSGQLNVDLFFSVWVLEKDFHTKLRSVRS